MRRLFGTWVFGKAFAAAGVSVLAGHQGVAAGAGWVAGGAGWVVGVGAGAGWVAGVWVGVGTGAGAGTVPSPVCWRTNAAKGTMNRKSVA